MLKLKSPPTHGFSVFIDLVENLDFEKLIGRINEKGNLINNEVECTIDDKPCIIKIHDYFKESYDTLPCLGFIFKLAYGFDGKTAQQILRKKFPDKINLKTEVAVILYEIKEIA